MARYGLENKSRSLVQSATIKDYSQLGLFWRQDPDHTALAHRARQGSPVSGTMQAAERFGRRLSLIFRS